MIKFNYLILVITLTCALASAVKITRRYYEDSSGPSFSGTLSNGINLEKTFDPDNFPYEELPLGDSSRSSIEFFPYESSGKSRASTHDKSSDKIISGGSNAINVEAETKACIEEHNAYRKRHNTPPLTYDNELELYALKRATYIAENDDFYPPNSKYGENLYQFWSPDPNVTINACAEAVSSWYKEIKKYHFNRPGFTSGARHFTQLVWKNSNKLGCASSESKSTGNIYVACYYDPVGNLINEGQNEANVLPLNSVRTMINNHRLL